MKRVRGECVVLVLGCLWFVLVLFAPGDRRVCVVRARGWRARQLRGKPPPAVDGSCGACLLPGLDACLTAFRACVWLYV